MERKKIKQTGKRIFKYINKAAWLHALLGACVGGIALYAVARFENSKLEKRATKQKYFDLYGEATAVFNLITDNYPQMQVNKFKSWYMFRLADLKENPDEKKYYKERALYFEKIFRELERDYTSYKERKFKIFADYVLLFGCLDIYEIDNHKLGTIDNLEDHTRFIERAINADSLDKHFDYFIKNTLEKNKELTIEAYNEIFNTIHSKVEKHFDKTSKSLN